MRGKSEGGCLGGRALGWAQGSLSKVIKAVEGGGGGGGGWGLGAAGGGGGRKGVSIKNSPARHCGFAVRGKSKSGEKRL